MSDGALAVVILPPIIGGAAGALLVPKHRILGGVGGFVLGIIATQVYARIVEQQSQTALQQALSFTSTSWEPGHSYQWTVRVPEGISTPTQLLTALQAAGWSNVVVRWFGPTKTMNTTNPPAQPWGGDPGLYVASGTWTGPAHTPIPAGAMSRDVVTDGGVSMVQA